MGGLLRRLFGVLLVLTALLMALLREPDRPVESLVARWAPPPSDFIEVKGQVVHLRDVGPRDDPSPLLLIHGTSASLHTWEGWADALKSRRRVISFDLPGFGLTGPFSAEGGHYAADDYRGDTYARFVLDLLDTLGVQHVVIAGNSLGGEVAWRTATLAPQRVQALVLLDAAGLPFTPQQLPLAWRLASLPVIHLASRWALPRSLVADGVHGVYGDPARVSPALVDRYHELALREGNRRALTLRLQQQGRDDDAARVDGIRAPTLILWGGRDRLIVPAVGQEFQRRIQGSRLVVFDDLGHVPQEEDPARTVVALQAFLAGL